jgi:hypothetical protein
LESVVELAVLPYVPARRQPVWPFPSELSSFSTDANGLPIVPLPPASEPVGEAKASQCTACAAAVGRLKWVRGVELLRWGRAAGARWPGLTTPRRVGWRITQRAAAPGVARVDRGAAGLDAGVLGRPCRGCRRRGDQRGGAGDRGEGGGLAHGVVIGTPCQARPLPRPLLQRTSRPGAYDERPEDQFAVPRL